MIRARYHTYHLDQTPRSARKPDLLMLHGFMGCGEVYAHLTPGLLETTNITTLDLLGHGESDKPEQAEAYHTDKQLEDLDHIIRSCFENPPILHGYSMGGRLALQYAVRYPKNIEALILESTTAGLRDTKEQEVRLREDTERAAAIRDDFPGFLENWNHTPLFKGRLQHELPPFIAALQEIQHPPALAASLEGFGTGIMPSCWDRLHTIQLPVLLISGTEDVKFCDIMSEMNKLIPNSYQVMVDNAAHRVHIDQPDKYIQTIRNFLINTLKDF